jgi:hypothetical protein
MFGALLPFGECSDVVTANLSTPYYIDGPYEGTPLKKNGSEKNGIQGQSSLLFVTSVMRNWELPGSVDIRRGPVRGKSYR